MTNKTGHDLIRYSWHCWNWR